MTIKNFVDKITFLEAREHKNLLLFPLFMEAETEAKLSYLLLEEALKRGTLKIGEVSQDGDVNTVFITNSGKEPVLIFDGEELLGAKQNRMVNATVLIPPQQKVKIDVSCVERGRWCYDTPDFKQAGIFGYSRLREQKVEQVAYSLRENRGFTADQGAVWEEIDRKQAEMGTQSETDALHKIYEDYKEELEKIWVKLLKSYAMEAMELRKQKKSPQQPDMQQILQAVSEAEVEIYSSVDIGTDFRLHGLGITGAALVVDDQLLHLSVFRRSEGESQTGSMARPGRRRRV